MRVYMNIACMHTYPYIVYSIVILDVIFESVIFYVLKYISILALLLFK